MRDFTIAFVIATIIITGLVFLKLPLFGSEQIYVASKEISSDFGCSGVFSILSCQTRHYYKVNGKYVTPNFYDDIEKGRTYVCRRTVIGELLDCEDFGGEE